MKEKDISLVSHVDEFMRWDSHMIADYCWSFMRDCDQQKHKKVPKEFSSRHKQACRTEREKVHLFIHIFCAISRFLTLFTRREKANCRLSNIFYRCF